MKNKNNIFLMLLAIATLLTAVIGATYAYFASVTDGTGVSTDLDVEAQANTAQFTAEGGTFGFTVTGADMTQANAGSLAKESTGSLEVNLTSPKLALCTFDVKFAWNEGSSYTPTATLADGVTEFGVLYEGNSYGAVNNAAKGINFDKLLTNHNGIVLDQAKIAILESDGTEKTETINLNFKVQMYNLNHDQSALAGGSSKSYNGKFYIDNVECTETKLPLNDVILASNEIYPDNIASPYVTNATGIDFGQVSSNTNGKGVYYTNEDTYNNDYTFYFRGDINNNYVKFGTLTEPAEGYSACMYNGEKVASTIESSDYDSETDEYIYYYYVGEAAQEHECGGGVYELASPAVGSDGQEYKYTNSYVDGGTIIDGAVSEWKYFETVPSVEKDIYWQIVRINEDDSIRLIYAGTGEVFVDDEGYTHDDKLNKGIVIEDSNYPSNSVKSWYDSNFVKYQDYLIEGIFHPYESTYISTGAEDPYEIQYYYDVYNRIENLKQPKFVADGRSKTGYYGQINADEALYAGKYIYVDSPSFITSSVAYADEYYNYYYDGGLGIGQPNYFTYYVRPVINLRPDSKISSGDGTFDNPYHIIVNEN